MKSDALKAHDCRTADATTRELMGCDKPVEPGNEWEFMGYKFDRCPAFYFDDPLFVADAMQIYNWREKGVLPYPGALVDQPAIILEVCDLMDQLIAERQQESIAQMTKNGKGSKHGR